LEKVERDWSAFATEKISESDADTIVKVVMALSLTVDDSDRIKLLEELRKEFVTVKETFVHNLELLDVKIGEALAEESK
jgi:hypothetical protein